MRLPVPTLRLAAVTAVLALAYPAAALVAGGAPVAVAVAANGALVVLVLLDALAAPSPSQVEVHRELPASVALGASADLWWSVVNPTGRRLRVHLADELAPSLGAPTRRWSTTVPPRASRRAKVTLRPQRRGRFVVDELVVRVEGPFGLLARQRARSVPMELRVYPPFTRRVEAELRLDRARALEVGRRSARGRSGGTEFDQLREYHLDDEFRRIDWAATARTGRPIVREHRAERNQRVVVLLDAGRVMAARVAGVPRLEHAMDAALMLTHVATRVGDRVGLVAFDRTVRAVVPAGHGGGQLARVTAAVYELQPVLAESDYRQAFAATVARFGRRSLVVVLTDLAAAPVEEVLLPAIGVLAAHHVVVVAGVSDPEVAAWAAAVPEHVGELHRTAAAVAALDERRRTAARLRAAGAIVVDAPAGALPAALVDAYLDVKARGRL